MLDRLSGFDQIKPLNGWGSQPVEQLTPPIFVDDRPFLSPLIGFDITRPGSAQSVQPAPSLPSNFPASYGPQRSAGVQLPGLSALASLAAATVPVNNRQPQSQISYSASASGSIAGQASISICQNCGTSTTPLWRRDEAGNVLCNACGLFFKLHNRPRPISLKTDVIKSRNRVKVASSGSAKRASVDNLSGLSTSHADFSSLARRVFSDPLANHGNTIPRSTSPSNASICTSLSTNTFLDSNQASGIRQLPSSTYNTTTSVNSDVFSNQSIPFNSTCMTFPTTSSMTRSLIPCQSQQQQQVESSALSQLLQSRITQLETSLSQSHMREQHLSSDLIRLRSQLEAYIARDISLKRQRDYFCSENKENEGLHKEGDVQESGKRMRLSDRYDQVYLQSQTQNHEYVRTSTHDSTREGKMLHSGEGEDVGLDDSGVVV